MEIENNRIPPAAQQETGQSATIERKGNGDAEASAGKTGNASGAADQISFTDTARLLQDLEVRVADSPVVDINRVAAVRSAIDNDTFRVNPERIAEKMIRLENALTEAR